MKLFLRLTVEVNDGLRLLFATEVICPDSSKKLWAVLT